MCVNDMNIGYLYVFELSILNDIKYHNSSMKSVPTVRYQNRIIPSI